jgi:hypothetical protein
MKYANTNTNACREGMFLLVIKLDLVTSHIAPYNGIVMKMRWLLVTPTEFYNLLIEILSKSQNENHLLSNLSKL